MYSMIGGAIVLTLAAVVHLLRVVYTRPLTIGDRSVPMWVSMVAVVVAGGLGIGLRAKLNQ